MKYIHIAIATILISFSFIGCETFTTFTSSGKEIATVAIFTQKNAPENYTSLGIITTSDASLGEVLLKFLLGVGFLFDFAPDYQALAVDQANAIDADGLIIIDKRTYEAIAF